MDILPTAPTRCPHGDPACARYSRTDEEWAGTLPLCGPCARDFRRPLAAIEHAAPDARVVYIWRTNEDWPAAPGRPWNELEFEAIGVVMIDDPAGRPDPCPYPYLHGLDRLVDVLAIEASADPTADDRGHPSRVTISRAPIIIQFWEVRARLRGKPLVAVLTWQPEADMQIAVQDPGKQGEAIDRGARKTWKFLRGFLLRSFPAHGGGRPLGSRSMDPAEWRVVMPFITAWNDEGATIPEIMQKLANKESEDDSFPHVPVHDPETIARWIREYRRELQEDELNRN